MDISAAKMTVWGTQTLYGTTYAITNLLCQNFWCSPKVQATKLKEKCDRRHGGNVYRPYCKMKSHSLLSMIEYTVKNLPPNKIIQEYSLK